MNQNPAVKKRTPVNKAAGKKRQANGMLTERNVILGVTGLTFVILVIFGARILQKNYNSSLSIEGVESFPGLSADHVTTTVNYPQTPPVGGPHNPTWQDCGVYIEPVANEYAVHSLEHGAVWITYQPELDLGQLEILQRITQQGTHRLLSPYPGIDSPIILSAWGYQLKLDRADDPRLEQFIAKYEQGATTPEPGAPCSGGNTLTRSQLLSGQS